MFAESTLLTGNNGYGKCKHGRAIYTYMHLCMYVPYIPKKSNQTKLLLGIWHFSLFLFDLLCSVMLSLLRAPGGSISLHCFSFDILTFQNGLEQTNNKLLSFINFFLF